MEFDTDTLAIITAMSSLVTAFVAIWIFFYGQRQRQFDIIESSFDNLQRFNEKALESGDNVLAAIQSGAPNELTDEKHARIIYFHYMRINRMFRAYQYWKAGFINERQADSIIQSHISTLKAIPEDKLKLMLERGYPNTHPHNFIDFLLASIKKADASKPINWLSTPKPPSLPVECSPARDKPASEPS